ncbi:galactoside-binding lectin [Cooperia oncophora]
MVPCPEYAAVHAPTYWNSVSIIFLTHYIQCNAFHFRFTINLHSKSADFSGNDVPLHISVRFDEGKVVMNTFSNGEWGKEERKSLPIKKGDSFDIRIRAHDDRFQIVIDQKEFKDYEHRLPLTTRSITHPYRCDVIFT